MWSGWVGLVGVGGNGSGQEWWMRVLRWLRGRERRGEEGLWIGR